MVRRVLLIPSSPALIPQLAPADAPGARLLAAARREVAAAPAARIDIVGSRERRWETAHTGSFRAWGAPEVTVGGGTHLPELLARFVLGPEQEANITEVRGQLGEPRAELTVVATDGSAGMTARAPLALLDSAPVVDRWCRDVLSGVDTGPLSDGELSAAGILDAPLWNELAGTRKRGARLVDADTTTGVARYVACWEVG